MRKLYNGMAKSYLTSEAAMGKSTTINLFGLAGCSDKLDSNILPIRIKIRELEEDIINFEIKLTKSLLVPFKRH